MTTEHHATGIQMPGDPGQLNHQQLIITLFGFYGRANGKVLPVSALIRLMADLGAPAPAVRSSVSRLKKRGLLRSSKVDGLSGYLPSPALEEFFREGDERIFKTKRASVNDRWTLAVFTVPETRRHLRHQIRSGLIRMGFGSVAPRVWIGPEHLQSAAQSYMNRNGLSEYIDWFSGDYVGERNGPTVVAQWWDLEALEALYSDFIERYEPLKKQWASSGRVVRADREQEAFADFIPMVTEWRRFPYLDPGLPLELLPENWLGLVAESLFAQLHDLLADRASSHARRILRGEPPLAPC